MSNNKHKYYVVWRGHEPGIYTSWPDCQAQVMGYGGALYKSFATEQEAREAYAMPPTPPANSVREAQASATLLHDETKDTKKTKMPQATSSCPLPPPDWRNDTVLPLPLEVKADALAVDAACSGNPGPMEYRGVYLATGEEIFHYGPVHGTNNIGEFLAIVHALALLKQRGRSMTIYSDSRNALLWVRAKQCRTKLARTARTEKLYQLIERAEQWLHTHDYSDIPLLKWKTSEWGEVPADFGRK